MTVKHVSHPLREIGRPTIKSIDIVDSGIEGTDRLEGTIRKAATRLAMRQWGHDEIYSVSANFILGKKTC